LQKKKKNPQQGRKKHFWDTSAQNLYL